MFNNYFAMLGGNESSKSEIIDTRTAVPGVDNRTLFLYTDYADYLID